mmetsp:Transcript_25346/g.83844  ORF Transcript_25346/g.83844 Transcript_25346/m.83844 type:complete len:383 (-) Transcript_25346:3774-4922(-)
MLRRLLQRTSAVRLAASSFSSSSSSSLTACSSRLSLLWASGSHKTLVARPPVMLSRGPALMFKQAKSRGFLWERRMLRCPPGSLRLSVTLMHENEEGDQDQEADEGDEDESAMSLEEQYADMASKVKVCYEDDDLLVVSKPGNLLVHKSYVSRQDKVFLLQIVRDLVKKQIYMVNRLDRATSGLVLFAKNSEMAALAQKALYNAQKQYICIVRGVPEKDEFVCDKPLTDRDSKDRTVRECKTSFQRLASFEVEIDEPLMVKMEDGTWIEESSISGEEKRFTRNVTVSILKATLYTGRRHQIRRHLQDLQLNILGDTSYGKGRINTAFREQYGLPRLCLHAWRLSLLHPVKNQEVIVEEPIPQDLRLFLHNLPSAPKQIIDTV